MNLSTRSFNHAPDSNPFVALDEEIFFRKVTAGVAVPIGSPAEEVGHDPADETASTFTLPTDIYISVFEISQLQWRVLSQPLGSTKPWEGVLPSQVVGDTGITFANRMPAFGVSYAQIEETLTEYNKLLKAWAPNAAVPPSLRLPTSQEWEAVARLGGGSASSAWWWGDSENPALVGPRAVVSETANGVLGPRLVGQGRQPAGTGLYDVAGNVWEWTSTPGPDSLPDTFVLRGGSWNDNLLSARSANKQYQHRTMGYATAGLRLIYVPPSP